MPDVNVAPFETETISRHGDLARAASLIADAPMTHRYGQKVGTGTCHHGGPYPSAIHLHERPRGGLAAPGG